MMFNIEKAYTDIKIDKHLLNTACKNLLPYDEFKQEVFLEALDSDCKSMEDFTRASHRVRMRLRKKSIEDYAFAIPNPDIIAYNDINIERIIDNG